MDTVEYFEAKAKMTDNCEIDCELCPLGWVNNAHGCACYLFEVKYPKEAISIVKKWQKGDMFRVPKDTPIDTKVLVSDDDGNWHPKHFAGFEGGKMCAWNDGTTSHTAYYKISWKSMKLAEEEA